MSDPAIGRKYVQECLRLAMTASANDRRVLLEQAGVWLQLAEEAEREAATKLSDQKNTEKAIVPTHGAKQVTSSAAHRQ